MCEKEYGSAKRCEFSLLQMLDSHKPGFPSGPNRERPIHNSMPPVIAKTARKMKKILRNCFNSLVLGKLMIRVLQCCSDSNLIVL